MDQLRSQDGEMIDVGLSLAEVVMRAVPRGAQLVDAADGMDALEMLSYRSEFPALAQRAGALVSTYFGEVRCER